MKNIALSIVLFFLFIHITYGQGSPSLKLTGSSPSLTKGNINTEVLTAIIQQKQEEIKQRVFKNTIIKQFNNPKNKYTKKLNNFTTFNYLYQLMDIITSGKNKTVITKSAIESSAEFAFIFGLALFVEKQTVQNSKVRYSKKRKIDIPKQSVEDFNILIDLCYDIIINNEDEFQKLFKFNQSIENANFARWHNADNAYLLAMDEAKDKNDTLRIKYLDDKRAEVKKDISSILFLSGLFYETIRELEKIKDEGLKAAIKQFKEQISTLTKNEVVAEINSIKTNYKDLLDKKQEKTLTKLSSIIDNNYDKFKQLYLFYTGLKRNNFTDFSLTQDQYYALRYILREFITVAKNQYPNDAIATVLDFLLENTIIEFNNYSGSIVNEDSGGEKLGYLYIDIESLISTISQQFSSVTKKGIQTYFTPFFSIGTNYANFTKTNSLISNADGTQSSLGNLYFASEKMGFKWKLWNWKYTHAFPPGQSYKYYGRQSYWKRPQKEPLISDFYLVAYGSGLLYNLVDLKSEGSFNHTIVGAGLGITFFNGLSANISLASPIINKKLNSENHFINFGIDIPIIEYISALAKKK